MEIRFTTTNKEHLYTATEIKYGDLRGKLTTYVNGYYETSNRNNPTRLFKSKKGELFLKLSGGRYYLENEDSIKLIDQDILCKAESK